MKPIHIRVPWLPSIRAINLPWPLILYRGDAILDPCIRVHEEYHWHEIRRWWVLPWYLAYLALLLVNIGKPADQHLLERGAYRAQRDCEDRR